MKLFSAVIVLLFTISLSAQVPKLYETAYWISFDDHQHREIDGNLYEIGNSILVLDSTLNLVNSDPFAGQDVLFDNEDNIIELTSSYCPNGDVFGTEYEIYLKKYNPSLDQIDNFVSETFPFLTDYFDSCSGKLLRLTDSTILVFLYDKRLHFNTSSFELINESSDHVLKRLDKIGWIDNDRILIQEKNSSKFYIADGTGMVYDSVNMNLNRDWIWHQEYLWATEGNELVKRNAQFEILESYTFDYELQYFKIGPDDELLIGGTQSIIALANADAAPEIIFESNHPDEIIKHGFYYNDELYLQGYETKAFDTNSNKVSTTRIANPIDFEKLPDVGITMTDITTSVDFVDPGLYTLLNVDMEIEIENKGSHEITSVDYIINGNCSEFMIPDFCGRGNISSLSLLPGEKTTKYIETNYHWSFSIFDVDSIIEIQFHLYNPNDQYDGDYIDNTADWTSIYVNTHDLIALSNIKVSPNPATNQIQLELDPSNSFSSLEIYNEMGQQVATHQVDKNAAIKTVDVSQLVSGMYTILLNGENKIHRSTFIKL